MRSPENEAIVNSYGRRCTWTVGRRAILPAGSQAVFGGRRARHGAGPIIVWGFPRRSSRVAHRTFTGESLRTAGPVDAAAVRLSRVQYDAQSDRLGGRVHAVVGADQETAMAARCLAAAYYLRYSHPCHALLSNAFSLAIADTVRRWRPLVYALVDGGQLRRIADCLYLACRSLP